jgi:hypothetical protein
VDPNEAVGEDPALEVGAQLALDEARCGAVPFSGAGKEGLDLLADNAVEDALLGLSARVADLTPGAA